MASRNVTPDVDWNDFSGRGDPEQRYRIYCRSHEGELTLIATCGSEAAVGVTICTLGREGAFADCALGVLDDMGQTGQKWIVRPWERSARNVSVAGSVLARSKKTSRGE